MPSSCQWTQAHQHHCLHSSPQQCSGFCGPSVWLYGKYHHHLGILWWILFLRLRLCQPGGMFCHMLGINVGSFCPLGLCRHASFLQGTVGLEPCMLLLYSYIQLFILPPGFRFPLVVLWENTNFDGSIQQGALQLWPSWLNMICSISICARSSGNCSCSSHPFYLEVTHYHVVLFDTFFLRDVGRFS